MLISALGAILFKEGNKFFLKIAENKLTQFFCWVVMFILAINKFEITPYFNTEIISIIALLIIVGQIRVNNRVVNIEIPAMEFLGKISHGIYVIHPLLIFQLSKMLVQITIPYSIKYFVVFGTIIGATILLAYLSFTYFEIFF